MTNKITSVTLVTPVHNEGESIYSTIVEFFDCYEESDISVNFIISEDGSSDNSVEQIQILSMDGKNYFQKGCTWLSQRIIT